MALNVARLTRSVLFSCARRSLLPQIHGKYLNTGKLAGIRLGCWYHSNSNVVLHPQDSGLDIPGHVVAMDTDCILNNAIVIISVTI